MEDIGVTEKEKQQVLTTSIDDEGRQKEAAKEVLADGEDVEEKPVGFINHLISNFTPGGEQHQEEEMVTNNKRSHEEEEEKPVGLIDQIISSFAPQDDNKEINKAGVEKDEEEEKRGGFLSQIMSNLVSSPASSPRAQAAADHLFDDAKTSSEKDGNGIVDNIVANLPTPLPDNAAPASDEASILIHSIIHD